jgi:hypothetical protein
MRAAAGQSEELRKGSESAAQQRSINQEWASSLSLHHLVIDGIAPQYIAMHAQLFPPFLALGFGWP